MNLLPRKIDVLVLCDNKMRDGLAIQIIHERLLSLGVRSLICNKLTLRRYYKTYSPSAVVLPYAALTFGPFVKEFSKKSRMIVHPTEGAVPEEDKGGTRVHKHDFFDHVYRYLLWGSRTQRLLTQSGMIPIEKTRVTSTARYEYYFPNFYQKIELKPLARPVAGTVGVATSGVEMVNSYTQNQFIGRIYRKRNMPDSDYFDYKADRNIEDTVWYSTAVMRTIFDMVDHLLKRGARPCVRPGPFEDHTAYHEVYQGQPVSIDNGTPLHEWLSMIELLVCGRSTLGIEAILMGKPVIYFLSLIKRLYEHVDMPTNTREPAAGFYHKPKTIDELMDLLDRARAGTLPITPDPEAFKQYLNDYYDLPRSEPPSLSIAKEIIACL